jgi:hypothetical protein
MAWLSQFLLGLPGQEYAFDISPASMDLEEGPVEVVNTNILGLDRKSILNMYKPTATISGNYLTLAQRQQFLSLCSVPDFLSFRTRDDWWRLEQAAPSNTGTTITLDYNSITRLDQTLAAGSYAGHISIVGVYDNWAMTGTNYYTGGSFAYLSWQITLGTTLPGTTAYVKYQYQGFMCNVRKLPTTSEGGWIDKFQYSSFQIEGA